ncbi:hypothetical protein CD798_08410 [Bacillaceae bacterium SAOS 7]|nr:hypothetical protein CD798_08410 [Bacillaceae bacterium SAOS 7]
MKGEKKDMSTITKPVEATKINLESNKEYEKITNIIRNPAKPNEFAKSLFKAYGQKRQEK